MPRPDCRETKRFSRASYLRNLSLIFVIGLSGSLIWWGWRTNVEKHDQLRTIEGEKSVQRIIPTGFSKSVHTHFTRIISPESSSCSKRVEQALLATLKLELNPNRNDAAQANIKTMSQQLGSAELNQLASLALNENEASGRRESALQILTWAEAQAIGQLSDIAVQPIHPYSNERDGHSRDAIQKKFEVALRVRALESLDRMMASSSIEVKTSALREMVRVAAQQPQPTLNLLAQFSLEGSHDDHDKRHQKLKKFIDASFAIVSPQTVSDSTRFQPESEVASPTTCFDVNRVKSEIESTFQISIRDENLRYRHCDSNNVMFQAFQALLYLKDLPPLLISNNEMDQGILGARPYDFLISHIKELAFERDGAPNCNQGTMAYIEDRLATIHICPWIKNFDVLTNAGVFVHESRHVDGFPHIYCDHGPYQNYGRACDPSFQAGGSYAVGTEFEVKVARSNSINEAVRAIARGYAITDFMERFNELPLGIHQGLLLASDDNSVVFFDGKNHVQILGPRASNQVFFATSSTRAGFFNPDDLSIGYFQSNGQVVSPTKSSLQDELRIGMSEEDARSLLDIAFVGEGTCLLFPRHMHCFKIGVVDSAFDVSLNGLPAVSFVSIDRSLIFQTGDVYLTTAVGLMYRLPRFDQLPDSDPFIYARAPGTLDVLGIGQIDSQQEVLLRSSHLLQMYDLATKSWRSIPGQERMRVKKLVGPFFWSEALDRL